MLRTVLLAIGTFYVLRLVYEAIPVVLVGFVGLLLGLSLGSLVDKLERYRIPRALSATGVVVLIFGTFIGIGAVTAPLLQREFSELQVNLPEAINRVEAQFRRVTSVFTVSDQQASSDTGAPGDTASTPAAGDTSRNQQAATDTTASPSSNRTSLREVLRDRAGALTQFVGPFLTSAASAFAGLFIVTFIAIYIAIDPVTYREGLLHLIPYSRRKRVREVMHETGTVLRQWLFAQLIAMAIVAAVTTTGLLLLQVKGAIALGLLAGLFEFVPFVGPVAAAIPAIGLAIVDSPEKAIAVAAFYFVIQQLESTLLTPIVMKTNLELPPILTILAQGVMGVVFGLLGILVAVPLLAATMVPIKMLYVRDVIGDAAGEIEGKDDK